MFSDCTMPPDSKETKRRNSNLEASPSVSKNNKVNLVPCSCMEVHPYSYFRWSGYFWGPWASLLWQMSSEWGSQKLIQGLVFHELTAYLSVFNLFYLNQLWPYYQKDVNHITINRIIPWSLTLQIFTFFYFHHSNFVDCKFFLESNSPGIHVL